MNASPSRRRIRNGAKIVCDFLKDDFTEYPDYRLEAAIDLYEDAVSTAGKLRDLDEEDDGTSADACRLLIDFVVLRHGRRATIPEYLPCIRIAGETLAHIIALADLYRFAETCALAGQYLNGKTKTPHHDQAAKLWAALELDRQRRGSEAAV